MTILKNKAKHAGHDSLAEMAKHHIDNWREGLKHWQAECEQTTGAHDVAWLEHELSALADFEKAVDMELAELCNKKT